jgi:DNA polymerase-3 subunit delta
VSLPETVLIIRCDKLESRQLKAKWVQAIESAGLVIQSKPIEARQLPQWCQRWAQQYHIQLTSEAAQLLAERVEGNLLAADQELQKLALRYGSGETTIPIDAAEIAQSVVDQTHYQLFALSTAMLLGQGQHARQILHRLQQEGLEAPIILWLLTKEIRILMNLVQAGQTGGMNAAFKRQGIWSSKQGEYQQALRRHAPQDWATYLSLALQIDLQIKGLAAGDPWSGLADLVFKITHGNLN